MGFEGAALHRPRRPARTRRSPRSRRPQAAPLAAPRAAAPRPGELRRLGGIPALSAPTRRLRQGVIPSGYHRAPARGERRRAHRELDRLAALALREAARKKRKLVERDMVRELLDRHARAA